MRKFIRIVAVLTLISLLLCGCTGRKAKNEGYELYRSSPVGVEIEYPDFWEMTEDKDERIVAFVTPSEGFADTYRDNVSIMSVEVGTEDMAYDNYVKSYIAKLPAEIAEYNLISESELTVDGKRAYKIVFEGVEQDGALRLMHVFIESGKYVFIYTLTAEPKSFDYFNMNSEIMLSTLKLLRK